MADIMIDTPDGIEHFKMAQCIARLRIETKTGLKFRQPTLKAVKSYYGCPYQTKAKALTWLEDLYERTYGWKYGESNVTTP